VVWHPVRAVPCTLVSSVEQLLRAGNLLETVKHYFWSRPITSPSLTDFLAGLWFAGFLLFTKVVLQSLLEPRLKRSLKRRKKECEEVSIDIFDELWIIIGGFALVSTGWFLLLTQTPTCSLWSTWGCIEGWPQQQVSRAVRAFYFMLFGWYTHDLMGLPFAEKPRLTKDLIAHHVLTIFLVTVSYAVGLTRLGLLTLTLFDLSNPFLHIAKVAHILKLDAMKAVTFPLFAAVFFFARVVMVPPTILNCTMFQGPTLNPPAWLYYPGNFLLLCLYVMQLVWFYKIAKIVVHKNPVEAS
jgi:hypothetical protein